MEQSGLPPPQSKIPRILVWFRRDLRLEDNPALSAALEVAEEVIPIYIYAPEEEGQFQPGRCSRWWLSSALQSFNKDLEAAGSRLLQFRASESRIALAALARDLGAQGVFFNHLYDPISMVRDNEVKSTLHSLGLLCQSFTGDVLHEPWEILDPNGKPFTCYDDFWRAHCAAPSPPPHPLPAPSILPPLPSNIDHLGRSDLGIMTAEEQMSNAQLEYRWNPGVAGGRKLLQDFLENGRLRRFDKDRAKTDRDSTSRLSPHIHFGEISVRTVYTAATNKGKEWGPEGATAVSDFLRQLGYREYSRYLSFHFPFTHERSLLEHLRAVPWRFDQVLFKAWRTGTTGYPLVDAGMREVWSTGWMYNRIRVVSASFMVKNLLLPWQWGLKHYWDALLDADLECDALGWQYCAGCLSDANPFSYMVDLKEEAKRCDPDGNYVRRWMPVLTRLPAKYIHAPWEAPAEVLADAGVELGVNYPWPIVDLDESKTALEEVVKILDGAKSTEETKVATTAAAAVVKGPFRPATVPDPKAAERVWGAGGGFLSEGGGIDGIAAGTAPSMKSTEESLDEEVQSNAMGGMYDDDDNAGSMLNNNGESIQHNHPHRHNHHQQPVTEGLVSAAVRNNTMSSAPSTAPISALQSRPPLPPSQAVVGYPVPHPLHLSIVNGPQGILVEPPLDMTTTAGVNGSNGSGGRIGASGGSNRASLTIAVVPTVSGTPSAAFMVPDTHMPMRQDSRDLEDAVLPTYDGSRSVSLPLAPHAGQMHGRTEPTEFGDIRNGVERGAASEEELVWPPEMKRQRQD